MTIELIILIVILLIVIVILGIVIWVLLAVLESLRWCEDLMDAQIIENEVKISKPGDMRTLDEYLAENPISPN